MNKFIISLLTSISLISPFNYDIETGDLSNETATDVTQLFNRLYSDQDMSITNYYTYDVGSASLSAGNVNQLSCIVESTINFNGEKTGYIDLLCDNADRVGGTFNFIVEGAIYKTITTNYHLSGTNIVYTQYRLTFKNVSYIKITHEYTRSQLGITSTSLGTEWSQIGYNKFRPVCMVVNKNISSSSIGGGSVDFGDLESTIDLIYQSNRDIYSLLIDKLGDSYKRNILDSFEEDNRFYRLYNSNKQIIVPSSPIKTYNDIYFRVDTDSNFNSGILYIPFDLSEDTKITYSTDINSIFWEFTYFVDDNRDFMMFVIDDFSYNSIYFHLTSESGFTYKARSGGLEFYSKLSSFDTELYKYILEINQLNLNNKILNNLNNSSGGNGNIYDSNINDIYESFVTDIPEIDLNVSTDFLQGLSNFKVVNDQVLSVVFDTDLKYILFVSVALAFIGAFLW